MAVEGGFLRLDHARSFERETTIEVTGWTLIICVSRYLKTPFVVEAKVVIQLGSSA